MPEPVRAAPVSVQQAYQFAAANPEVLVYIPNNDPELGDIERVVLANWVP